MEMTSIENKRPGRLNIMLEHNTSMSTTDPTQMQNTIIPNNVNNIVSKLGKGKNAERRKVENNSSAPFLRKESTNTLPPIDETEQLTMLDDVENDIQNEPNERKISISSGKNSLCSNRDSDEDESIRDFEMQLRTKVKERLTLNLRGTRFTISKDTLQWIPQGRLARLTPESIFYDPPNKEYYFDRNPEAFNYVLDFYVNREMHFPQGMCVHAMRNELEYWGLDIDNVSPCCWNRITKVSDRQ